MVIESQDSVFGAFEIPVFKMGQKVIHKVSRTECIVVGFIAWHEPVIVYQVRPASGHYISAINQALMSQTDLIAIPTP